MKKDRRFSITLVTDDNKRHYMTKVIKDGKTISDSVQDMRTAKFKVCSFKNIKQFTKFLKALEHNQFLVHVILLEQKKILLLLRQVLVCYLWMLR